MSARTVLPPPNEELYYSFFQKKEDHSNFYPKMDEN